MQDQPVTWELLLLCLGFLAYVFYKSKKPRRRRSHKQFKRSPSTGIEWSGIVDARVVRVLDGDTVDVKLRGRNTRIRLDSIDCPEDGQPWGDKAKFGLIKLVGGKNVSLEGHGLDYHGRSLATIFVKYDNSPKLMNVNERMVTLGHAWVMRRYYTHLPRDRQNSLNRLENWAKSKKVGLWNTANPIPPWKWRITERSVKR